MIALSDNQYQKLSRIIYQRLGLCFEEQKFFFLNKRVEKRMEVLGLVSADEYLFLLGYCDANGMEMQQLANLITTNETYMFREFEQLEAFANHCLPEILEKRQSRNDRRLRIWSAGCSSGEEPYTIAIILREVCPAIDDWQVQITATDIDENMLERTRRATYDNRAVKYVPDAYRERHLIPTERGFRIHPDTKRLVNVEHLNLHDHVPMQMMRNYDFIFCRNVLIYFDDESRKTAVNHFYGSLNSGGYIFLGHSESVGRITTAFQLKRMGQQLIYRKP